MFQKIRVNTRLHFLLIAISLAVISGFMGLAAYLTDVTDPLYATFKIRYGRDFGIGISSDNYSKVIIPMWRSHSFRPNRAGVIRSTEPPV